ncbi:MAG: ParB/RepB/Spo0J family partition protein [Clostridia bacterium]|nr:ParB/RepB/Spo0J family partition protein [Oscillospiraceae bacterium]MBR2410289.1 ParB/RepB/Spo0J family partition protein [Clostridia bacterium]
MAKKGGLGKGFDSLFLDNSSDALSDGGSVMLPIGDIEPDRGQPRTKFSEEALSELEASIREFGVLQPLLVRPMSDGSYKIVAGERRWRAARRAELTEVPVIIKSLTDAEAAAIALIENLQREDLNPIEEAAGIRKLIEEFGFTQEEAAEKLSKSRPAITNALRLLSLPKDAMKLLEEGKISAGHARALLGLDDENLISDISKEIVEKQLSVRQTEQLVKALKKPKKEKMPKKARDKFFDEVELALSGVLARKVNVVNSGKGGRLEIEFFDTDDLQKLAKLFSED